MVWLAIATSRRDAGVEGVADFLLEADIVVCELTHVGVVDTEDFSLLSGTETETGDDVHYPENDGGNNEGVAEAGGRISELICKLNVVLVQPTTWDDSDSIESSHTGLCEDTCEEVAKNTANTVGGEDVKGIIVTEEKFELSGEIANSSSSKAEKDRSGSANETRGGGDCDETGNSPRAKTNSGPLPLNANPRASRSRHRRKQQGW